jgi:hypothetical protein
LAVDQINMSSLALPPEAVAHGRVSRALPAVFSRRGVDVLLAVALVGFAVVLIEFLPPSFNVDSWLGLVAGREVWQSGVPHHDVLTAMSHGATWVDQQWLSQLAMYALYLLGGLGLLGVANVALLVLSVAGAVIGARKLGASPRAVLMILPLCLWLIAPSHEVRTQEFAMPLFVATAYLLASDSRAPSRRVYWCLPMLVLWANLHGSATLGAALIGLRGLTLLWERRDSLRLSARAWGRPLILILGAPLCLLATPYGLSIVSYYRTMLLGSTVMHAVSEWQPITSVAVVAVAFFITAGIAVWCCGRDSSRTTLWERLALLALAAGSIDVIRNVLFFGLLALIVMPVALGLRAQRGEQPAARGRGAINAALSAVALVALLLATGVTLARPASAIEFNYQRTGVLTAVEKATRADPSLKVLTDVRFSDWLLWRDPALAGKIASDASWELLTSSQLNGLEAVFNVIGTDWKQGARGYGLIVLDKKYDPNAVQGFLAEPGSRVLYSDTERIVILRSAREAG